MPASPDAQRPQQRPVRSYVLRQGRMSNAQQRAYASLMPAFGIVYAKNILNLEQAFGRVAPTVLEIGCGMGETTAAIADAQRAVNYLGIEVHTPGVGSLLKQIEERQLHNVRIIQHDAVEVVQHMIAPATLAGIHIFFPDPWPKKRHHKRRLMQPAFANLLAARLCAGGYLHFATDWQDYAEHALAVLRDEPALANTAQDYAPRPDYRPLTKFEQRGLKLGHGVWDILFRKK